MHLEDGSRVGVIGGGPAGSFFSIFLLDAASRMGIDVSVDIFEPRNFDSPGPKGCNMCGGIISESLVQMLAAEGINLPPTVVQRGIDSYILHMDIGSVHIKTPLQEKRIGAVHRGGGPRDVKVSSWRSFDGHLQKLAEEKGANTIGERVSDVAWADGRPQVRTRDGISNRYDLLVVAVGVNSSVDRLFADKDIGYRPPGTTRTHIQEYFIGQEEIGRTLGSSMHVFLLDIPKLEFAAIVPKGDYVSVCLLGADIDAELVETFMNSKEVRSCFAEDWSSENRSCWCSPKINVQGAVQPLADRIAFIGDCGSTRLYKDGIGAAYRTAKAAATTAVYQGISQSDFKEYYGPACQRIESDNAIGKLIFLFTRFIQKSRVARRAVLRMVADEQEQAGDRRRMSTVLWDMFTGSAPYKDILIRTLHPAFWSRLIMDFAVSIVDRK